MDKLEQAARSFAEVAHGDQKYGKHPYVKHLAAVRAVLEDFGFSGDLGVAAWLHDVLEDTKVTSDQLELAFGSTVTHLVWAVTGVGVNRKERNECAYGRIERNPKAIILKLADRIANVEACAKTRDHRLGMYRQEHVAFKARLVRLAKFLDEEEIVMAMWARLDLVFSDPV
jgi:(p)ppGpp synthase/HD superfamily hydrolase